VVIGGGVAGMTAALTIADQGFHVHLVEQSDRLGGFARNLKFTLEGNSPPKLIRYLIEKITHHPNITVYLKSSLVSHNGPMGAFNGTLQNENGTISVQYGPVTMAKSAGQQAMKILCKKEMTISAAKAQVDPDKCSACLLCVRVCPYGAPFINEDGVSQIPPSACAGCGICVSECPSRAITLKHCTDDQILAKIDALLEPTDSSFLFPGSAG